MSIQRKIKPAFPGDKLAVIEEFEGGEGTYIENGNLRSLTVGEAIYEMKEHRLRVKRAIERPEPVKKGDVVIAQVEAVQTGIIITTIYYINGKPSDAGFTALIILDERERRSKRTICKAGDLIRAKVLSTENAVTQLYLGGEELGVIYSICSQCGGRVVKVNRRLKCVECGVLHERKLARDYGDVKL